MRVDTHLHRGDTATNVEDMVQRIVKSGKISRADQQQFMSALLSQNAISKAEQVLINRVFDLLRSGRLRVVD